MLLWWQCVRNHSNLLRPNPVTDDDPNAAQLLHCAAATKPQAGALSFSERAVTCSDVQ